MQVTVTCPFLILESELTLPFRFHKPPCVLGQYNIRGETPPGRDAGFL